MEWMTAEEKEDYAKNTKVEGNKRLDFRFAYQKIEVKEFRVGSRDEFRGVNKSSVIFWDAETRGPRRSAAQCIPQGRLLHDLIEAWFWFRVLHFY